MHKILCPRSFAHFELKASGNRASRGILWGQKMSLMSRTDGPFARKSRGGSAGPLLSRVVRTLGTPCLEAGMLWGHNGPNVAKPVMWRWPEQRPVSPNRTLVERHISCWVPVSDGSLPSSPPPSPDWRPAWPSNPRWPRNWLGPADRLPHRGASSPETRAPAASGRFASVSGGLCGVPDRERAEFWASTGWRPHNWLGHIRTGNWNRQRYTPSFSGGYGVEIRLICPDFRPNSTYKPTYTRGPGATVTDSAVRPSGPGVGPRRPPPGRTGGPRGRGHSSEREKLHAKGWAHPGSWVAVDGFDRDEPTEVEDLRHVGWECGTRVVGSAFEERHGLDLS